MRKILSFLSVLWMLIFIHSCKEYKNETNLYKLDGTSIKYRGNNTFKLNAYVFLSPECPLSEASLVELTRLDSIYKNSGYTTNIIIPGELYSVEEINTFIKNFNIKFPTYIDKNYECCDLLKAVSTPEYFLVDEHSEILYQGAIDDRALDNEIIRQEAKNFYAENAIKSVIDNKPISITKTKAVGCYIER